MEVSLQSQQTLPGLGLNWRELRIAMIEHLPPETKTWLDFHPLIVLINRYKRKYFVCKNDGIRVTLDSDIRVYDQTHHPYPNYYFKTNTPRIFVLEFKLPREFRNKAAQIISGIPIRVSRHSKYISGLRSIYHF